MTAASRRPTSTLPLPFVAPQDAIAEAEAVVLGLLAGYYGQDGHGAGLLVRREGRMHTARCMAGYRVVEGFASCSDRCRQVAEAIRAAADWLKRHEHAAPQPARGTRKGV